jgi:hypothetical protein
MIVYKNGHLERCSSFPNGNFTENPDVLVIDETTVEGVELADKIVSNYPFYYVDLDSLGKPISVTFFNPISATADKLQILADGIDTATITATIDDLTTTENIELWHGETLVESLPAVAGSASFLVTMSAPGTLTLMVKSTTKYGQRDVTIEGV